MGIDVKAIVEIVAGAWVISMMAVALIWWRMSGHMLKTWDKIEADAESIKSDAMARRAEFRAANRGPTKRFTP